MRIPSAVAAAALILVAVQPAAARIRSDDQPPTFAGLVSATTCVPGPIGGGQTTSYTLRWEPAIDNVTRPKKTVCATSFVTPPLPADKAVYFVVRARDKAGNRDSNTVEREGQNLCV